MARNSLVLCLHRAVITVAVGTAILYAAHVPAQDDVLVVGGTGWHCGEDPQCFNRLHPDIPMAAHALPGQTILLKTRNSADLQLDPGSA